MTELAKLKYDADTFHARIMVWIIKPIIVTVTASILTIAYIHNLQKPKVAKERLASEERLKRFVKEAVAVRDASVSQ